MCRNVRVFWRLSRHLRSTASAAEAEWPNNKLAHAPHEPTMWVTLGLRLVKPLVKLSGLLGCSVM